MQISLTLMCRVFLFAVAAAFSSLVAPSGLLAADAVTIVGFGDSITKGARPAKAPAQGVAANETFCARIEEFLKSKKMNVTVVNKGIGGNRTDQAIVRLEKDVLALKPQVVLIMFGTNDSAYDPGATAPRLPVKTYEENLRKIVSQIQGIGARPVLMTPPPLASNYNPPKKNAVYSKGDNNFELKNYVEAMRRVAKDANVTLVDHYEQWVNVPAAELNTRYTDGCHPNADGHRIIASSIILALFPDLAPKK